jgi:RsmE family RNA methyltransferase
LAEECYRPLLIEGLQQARDTRLPQVSIHRQLKVLIEDVLDTRFPEGLRLVAHPDAGTPIAPVVHDARPERVLLAIGPEGGWNTFELDLLAAHGFHAASIGPRALRVDTACTALLAIVHGALAS